MISLAKYKKLSYNFKRPYAVYKGIRYHLSTLDGKTIIEDGQVDLYNLLKGEEKRLRKQQRVTSKNYHTMEETLGVNPKHKSITCNQTICKVIEQIAKDSETLEIAHTRKHLQTMVDKFIPHQTRATTILKHIAKDNENNFTTDRYGNLVKVVK